jgi:hypothetical protein
MIRKNAKTLFWLVVLISWFALWAMSETSKEEIMWVQQGVKND